MASVITAAIAYEMLQEATAAATAVRKGRDFPVKLDEFGRRMDMSIRADTRERRRAPNDEL
ncbi:hypothetical protein RND71_022158 [Anisodus tanguticus]|uniref:Uncharacterized protein n=1 Tax=Anisodus tanguticus TaxID=243964 RepID=A0AAE1RZ63_9SOLA|nr:hypothetical protein RND71_022158 [Anisodus tanguticus]